ncbi:MAG: hypothetical protein AAFY76_19965, partial [Cyanobacteria bacterium J06649_11]
LTKVSDAELSLIASLFEQPLLALDIKQKKIDNILKLRIIDEETRAKWEKYEQSQTFFSHNFIPPVANFTGRDEELKSLHHKMINRSGSEFGTVFSASQEQGNRN